MRNEDEEDEEDEDDEHTPGGTANWSNVSSTANLKSSLMRAATKGWYSRHKRCNRTHCKRKRGSMGSMRTGGAWEESSGGERLLEEEAVVAVVVVAVEVDGVCKVDEVCKVDVLNVEAA